MLENKQAIFVISEVLNDELINAPQYVKELLSKYDSGFIENIETTDEAETLAENYIAEKVVGITSLDDCRHIAYATISKVDILASWNFKHIVNINRIRGYNSVNLKNGYQMLEIRNPKELINYGNE
jgi:hypothetical protein